MKSVVDKGEREFVPVKLSIELQNLEELAALLAMLNTSAYDTEKHLLENFPAVHSRLDRAKLRKAVNHDLFVLYQSLNDALRTRLQK